jgi:hypothetical protein
MQTKIKVKKVTFHDDKTHREVSDAADVYNNKNYMLVHYDDENGEQTYMFTHPRSDFDGILLQKDDTIEFTDGDDDGIYKVSVIDNNGICIYRKETMNNRTFPPTRIAQARYDCLKAAIDAELRVE